MYSRDDPRQTATPPASPRDALVSRGAPERYDASSAKLWEAHSEGVRYGQELAVVELLDLREQHEAELREWQEMYKTDADKKLQEAQATAAALQKKLNETAAQLVRNEIAWDNSREKLQASLKASRQENVELRLLLPEDMQGVGGSPTVQSPDPSVDPRLELLSGGAAQELVDQEREKLQEELRGAQQQLRRLEARYDSVVQAARCDGVGTALQAELNGVDSQPEKEPLDPADCALLEQIELLLLRGQESATPGQMVKQVQVALIREEAEGRLKEATRLQRAAEAKAAKAYGDLQAELEGANSLLRGELEQAKQSAMEIAKDQIEAEETIDQLEEQLQDAAGKLERCEDELQRARTELAKFWDRQARLGQSKAGQKQAHNHDAPTATASTSPTSSSGGRALTAVPPLRLDLLGGSSPPSVEDDAEVPAAPRSSAKDVQREKIQTALLTKTKLLKQVEDACQLTPRGSKERSKLETMRERLTTAHLMLATAGQMAKPQPSPLTPSKRRGPPRVLEIDAIGRTQGSMTARDLPSATPSQLGMLNEQFPEMPGFTLHAAPDSTPSGASTARFFSF